MIDLKHELIKIQRRRNPAPPVTRRAAITAGGALMAAAAGDGLTRPLNAPPAQQVTPGIQPGVTGTGLFSRVIVFGPGGNATGVFIYNGTPGRGNTPIAAMSNSATDPFGNDIQPGDASALGTIIAIGATPAGGTPSYIQLVPGTPQAFLGVGTGDQAEASPGKVSGLIQGAGPTRAITSALTAPRVTGQAAGAGASLLLQSPSPDLTVPPFAILLATDGVTTGTLAATPAGITVQNGPLTATAGTPATPTVVSTDSWHLMTPLQNSWAGAAAPNAAPQYRLNTNNGVEIAGTLNGVAATATQFFTLPARYRPALRQVQAAVGATGNVTAARGAFIQLDTAGNLTLTGAAALPAAGVFVFSVTLPLDLI